MMNIHARDIAADIGVTHTVHWDIEARSELHLPTAGAWKYAAHPSTTITCVAYVADDQPVKIWLPVSPSR
jgi:hypothetical protein